MRIVIGIVLAAAVWVGVLRFRDREPQEQAVVAPSVAAAAKPTPAPPSQHNWPKRALDRAADAKTKAAERVNDDEQ